jgi:hypothetical protein
MTPDDTQGALMSEEQTPVAAVEIPLDRLAKMYIKMRDRVQELTRIYDSEVEAIKLQMATVTGAMKEQVRALGEGVDSVKTEHGTIMLGTSTRYYADDWDAFGKFVIATGSVDLMEKRVAQGNMKTYLTNHPDAAPPGLSSVSEITVTVRRPSAK